MKKALIISITLNILIVLFIAGKRYYYSYGAGAGPKNYFDTWNISRNSLLSTLPIDSTDVVFVGNSITEGFPVDEIFGSKCKNRGIGGNNTYHIAHRIEPIAIGHPKKIFIEAGVNDLNAGVGVDSVFKNYQQIINIIRDVSPSTTIYVQSVFPTCKDYSKVNTDIIKLNTKLNNYCSTEGIQFINIYEPLVTNAQLDSQYTEDGIHLNGKGYAVWIEQIKNFVQ